MTPKRRSWAELRVGKGEDVSLKEGEKREREKRRRKLEPRVSKS